MFTLKTASDFGFFSQSVFHRDRKRDYRKRRENVGQQCKSIWPFECWKTPKPPKPMPYFIGVPYLIRKGSK